MPEARKDRERGLLVGLAVGDALGAPVEFDDPAAIAPQRERLFGFPGGGAFGWAPGEFTDDTQMAILLGRRLVEDRGLDQDRLAADFAAWATHPLTGDVGNQTRNVLEPVASGTPWRDAIAALDADAAGNGGLMRCAPVALAARSRDEAMLLASAQSEVTHPNVLSRHACAVFAGAVYDALEGEPADLEQLASGAWEQAVGDAVRAAAATEPPSMSGFVLHTLTGALWAVRGAEDFADAVWRAVSLGRDADTVGAVAGALAGARWGLAAIPQECVGAVTSRHPLFEGDYPDELLRLADALGG